MAPDDPTVVRAIAVSAEDVVAAFERTRQSGPDAVLRVTPPFHGRMRARSHVPGDDEYRGDPTPVHVPAACLVDADAVPPYPHADDTGDALRADPAADYSVDAHYDRHRDAVEAWRAAVRDAIRDEVPLDLDGTAHRVDVAVLD
jgi:hypothetical protein